MVATSVTNNQERSAMVTSIHFVSKDLETGNYNTQKIYRLENDRTDRSADNVSFDTEVEGGIIQGKVHTHTDNNMPPSPGDVLNLGFDTDKEGFFR